MASNVSQGAYAPLPQSLSDSDSDKESNEPGSRSFGARKLQNGHDNRNGYAIPNHVINMAKAKSGFSGMSRLRKCAFITSILVCVLVVVLFLWVLPCSSSGMCPMKVTSWKNEHEGVEFKGRINVIKGANAVNLALLTKKSLKMSDNQSGAIALKSTNGAVAWFIPQVRTPYELNCDLIDVNKDLINDCLLLGETGLEAIDPITAVIIWHLHSQKMLINNIDFPKLLPDLNDDGVNEMITITNRNSLHNKIIIICGRTGRLLVETIINACVEISDFKYEDKLFIYLCSNNTRTNYYKLTLNDLRFKLRNDSYFIKPIKIEYQPDNTENYVVTGKKLRILNEGNCPDCKTRIELSEETSEKRLWAWSHENSYTMRPVTFAFKQTRANLNSLKGHLNGFILKMWEWPERRNATFINGTIQRNMISEKVVLLTFNDTDVHAINVSYIQITQLCFPNKECQPDLSNRNESLLITDLDEDNSQELISYSTSFKCTDQENNVCQLISTMEVIRLEAELPKLYSK